VLSDNRNNVHAGVLRPFVVRLCHHRLCGTFSWLLYIR